MSVNVVVNDLLVNYRLTGKGKLVVLLHGWGDNLKGVAALHDALAEHYQVVAVDLPGFGATQAPQTVWRLDDYAEFVAHFLKKLEPKQPYAVIGHSNGGAIAIRAVAQNLLQPEKLILLAAAGVRDTQKLRRATLKIIAKTGNVATMMLPESQRQRLRKKLYGVAGSDQNVAPHLKETFRAVVREDVQADAAKIKTETLLIYASQDQAVPVTYGARFHQLIEGSHLEIVPDAHHFVHLDQPAKVTQLIEDFLK